MLLRPLFLIGFLGFLSGCSQYQMGIPHSAVIGQVNRIFVELPDNETYYPELRVPVVQALRSELAQTGKFQVVGSAVEADAILSLRLMDYDRQRIASRADDSGLAAVYRGNLIAVVDLVSNVDGRAWIQEQELEISVDVLARRGVSQSEFVQTPVFASLLATEVRDLLLSTW